MNIAKRPAIAPITIEPANMEKIKTILKKFVKDFEVANMRRARAIVASQQRGLGSWE
jgi:hypothetical protein